MTKNEALTIWYAYGESDRKKCFIDWLYAMGFCIESVLVDEDAMSQNSWFLEMDNKRKEELELELAAKAQDRFSNERS